MLHRADVAHLDELCEDSFVLGVRARLAPVAGRLLKQRRHLGSPSPELDGVDDQGVLLVEVRLEGAALAGAWHCLS
jgi:hypothetical protein